MRTVEFWYDVVCPYAYLGSTQIEAVAERSGAEVRWRPFLLGGVLKALGNADGSAMRSMSVAKQHHNLLDMYRWAEHFGVPLEMPAWHPRRTVLAMRAILAAGERRRRDVSRSLFQAYWVRGEDVSRPEVVAEALDRAGVDGEAGVARAEAPEIKQSLRDQTDEALRRGVFGAPTMFVGGEMFWGQDRLDFVARALRT